MATRILEHGGWVSSDQFPAFPVPLVAQAPLTATASSQQSAAVSAGTSYVEVDTDEAVHVLAGANPTVTTSYKKVKAGEYALFAVPAGGKIAIIAA